MVGALASSQYLTPANILHFCVHFTKVSYRWSKVLKFLSPTTVQVSITVFHNYKFSLACQLWYFLHISFVYKHYIFNYLFNKSCMQMKEKLTLKEKSLTIFIIISTFAYIRRRSIDMILIDFTVWDMI